MGRNKGDNGSGGGRKGQRTNFPPVFSNNMVHAAPPFFIRKKNNALSIYLFIYAKMKQ